MSEKLLESELQTDIGVDSLQIKFDSARLEEFQKTLRGSQARAMDAFIRKLNALEGLNAQAQELRLKRGSAPLPDIAQVGGVGVPVESEDPTVAEHNKTIRSLHKAIEDFEQSRSEFLSGFATRYLSGEPQRSEPIIGQRVPRRTGPDYFRQMLDRPPEPVGTSTAGVESDLTREARYAAFLETPEAKKFDTMSDEEVKAAITSFRRVGTNALYEKFATVSDNERDALKRIAFALKSSNRGQFDAFLRNVASLMRK